MNFNLVLGADRESVHTDNDEAFCRVFGVGKGFAETENARAKADELVSRWNSHKALCDALQHCVNSGLLNKPHRLQAEAALKAAGLY